MSNNLFNIRKGMVIELGEDLIIIYVHNTISERKKSLWTRETWKKTTMKYDTFLI